MTRIVGFLPYLLLLNLLPLVTLPLLLILGLGGTSSGASVTSRLTPDEPVVPPQNTPLRTPIVTSWMTNVTVPSNAEDEIEVSSSPNKEDEQRTTSQNTSGPRTLGAENDSLTTLPSSDNLPSEKDEQIVDCNYNTKTQVTSANGTAGNHNKTKGPLFSLENVGDDNMPAAISSHLRVRRQAIVLQGPLWTDKTTLFVELVVIGDYSFSNHYGGNAIDRIMKVVGVTNALYAPLGVVVVLVDVELWYSGDKAYVHPKKETTLKSMKKYREEMLKKYPNKPNDNLMLITRALEAGAAGVAATGGMCCDYRSVNIVQDVDGEEGIVGSVLAHEMGHNLGMKHDGEGENFPRFGNCHDAHSLMKPQISRQEFNANLQWSDCSREYVTNMLKTVDLDCLKNIPTESYSRRSCGNGIVEPGEDCDCGPPELCKNRCCNPETCKFAPQAKCASGSCCNTATCLPHAAGTMCRDSLDHCDLPEYCSGTNEYCPRDVVKGDGAYCWHLQGQGHCYKGVCGSHDGRCRQLWGSQATVADDQCYQTLTESGDRAGNCGFSLTNDQYIYCNKESLHCGTLYCDARGHDKVVLSDRRKHYAGSKTVGYERCQYVEGFLTHYPAHEWLTPDGASCGNRKMCVNQKCTQISGSDDSLSCPRKCSGQGVCNSEGKCHCNVGYAPPDCSKRGPGGSYDSGPVLPSGSTSGGGGGGGGDRRPTNPRTTKPRPTNPWSRRPRPTTPPPRRPTTPRYYRPGDDGRSVSPSRTTGMMALWIILIIIALLMVIIVVLMCCFWGRIRRWWEISGRSRVSPVAPGVASCIDSCCCHAISKVVHWMVSTGPLGKIQKPFQKKDPEVKRARGKSPGYNVDVEVKRASQVDYLDTEEYLTRKQEISIEVITRPKYQQSISVDSGCIIDDPDEPLESPSTNISMSSLVSAFRNYTTKTSSEVSENEKRKSNIHDHQKDVSLRRLVMDPLAGHRTAKQGLPHPYQKPPNSRHSISTDISIGSKDKGTNDQSKGLVDSNVYKSHDNLPKTSKLASNPFILSNGKEHSTNGFTQGCGSLPNVHTKPSTKNNTTKSSPKKPIMPPQRARTASRMTPPRDSPPLPPVKEVVQENVQGLQSTEGNPGKVTAWRNNTDVVNHSKMKELSPVSNGKVNGRTQLPEISKFDTVQQRPFKDNAKSTTKTNVGNHKSNKTNVHEFPKAATQNRNATDVPRNNDNKNVKNIAQKFENL